MIDNDLDLARLQYKASVGSAAVGGLVHVLVVPTSTAAPLADLNPGERIVGVALWYPPNTSPNATPEQRATGVDAFVAAAEAKNPKLVEWWTSYVSPLTAPSSHPLRSL